MKKEHIFGIGILVAVVATALLALDARVAQAPIDDVRETSLITLEARIGQEVSGLGVSITPLSVLADSRCPVDVQCIQAGTVRMRAQLASGLGAAPQEFTLGQPITTEAEIVTLTSVLPSPRAGVVVPEGDYTFVFTIAKR